MSNRDYNKRKDYEVNEEETVLAEEDPMEPETKNGIIKGAPNVNVRSEPSLTSPVVVTLREGTKVTILGEDKDFYRIRYAASEDSPAIWGYVHSGCCKEVDS